jgi:hypothetical protein
MMSRNVARPVFSIRIGASRFVQTALQQDEPAVEVVVKLRQLERGVEADFLVREVGASFPVVVAEE